MPPQNIDYKLKGLEKLNEEEKARLQRRVAELKAEIGAKYAGYWEKGKMSQGQAMDACYRELLSTVAREFNLVLLGFYERL